MYILHTSFASIDYLEPLILFRDTGGSGADPSRHKATAGYNLEKFPVHDRADI